MSWIDVFLPMLPAACLTIAFVHALVWLRRRGSVWHLALMASALSVAALTALEASLREDFEAFHSVLVLTSPMNSLANVEFEPFLRKLPTDDANIRSFEALLNTGKPRCGQVRDSQRDFLFGPESASIGSVALVPLGEGGSVGLLALGSAERERFHPGMSTEFLKRMGELITDALSR